MEWNFLLVAILVIPFVVSSDRDYNEEDDTELDHMLANETLHADGITKFLCGRRPAMMEPSKGKVNRVSEDEEEDYVNRTVMDRIQGGRNQIYGQVPWHVNLIYEHQIGFKFYHRFCNGAVYNRMWVITSARCASNFSHHELIPAQRYVPNIWMFIGDHVTDYRDKGEQRFRIAKYIIHPAFDPIHHLFDIAILKVHPNENGEYIQMNDYVQPICLTQHGENLTDAKNLLISGMGNIFQGPYARAEWVRVMTATPIRCIQQNLQNLPLYCLTNTGGATPCDGDNGGPVATQVGGVWVLFGLVSFINPDGCLPTRFPPYITAMYPYSEWVNWKVGQDAPYQPEIPSRT